MDSVFVEQKSNLKLDFLLNIICKLGRGLPGTAGGGKLKIHVQFKNQSGTQYIEGTKREDCFLYALE